MCNCSLKNQRIQIGILYPMVPVSSQKISMPMKSCLIQFGVKCFRFSVARGRRTVIYTSESSNRNSAILRGPGILGDLHICNPTLRKTEKQAILFTSLWQDHKYLQLANQVPNSVIPCEYLDPNYINRLTKCELEASSQLFLSA